jgi:poly-beta-hydroxybutyrate-responsive repressor
LRIAVKANQTKFAGNLSKRIHEESPMPKRTPDEQKEIRLHGDLLSTTLLAFLRNSNAYGYQLAQQLEEAGLPRFDSGTVYRTLRQLEKAGLVSSFWDTSESGPARRMYSLAAAGDIFLTGWIEMLGNYQKVLRATLERLDPARAAADRKALADEDDAQAAGA